MASRHPNQMSLLIHQNRGRSNKFLCQLPKYLVLIERETSGIGVFGLLINLALNNECNVCPMEEHATQRYPNIYPFGFWAATNTYKIDASNYGDPEQCYYVITPIGPDIRYPFQPSAKHQLSHKFTKELINSDHSHQYPNL